MSGTKRLVLIIGDSISIGYTPQAAERLGEGFDVRHNAGNAAFSENLLANLDAYLDEAPGAELICFNCGLHDIKLPRDGSGALTPIDTYRANLGQIVDRLGRTGAKLLWVRTTPVLQDRHALAKTFDRRQIDVDAYNAAADAIIAAAGIDAVDLHATICDAGVEDAICDDGVHLTDSAYRLLGDRMAEAISQCFTDEPPSNMPLMDSCG